METVQSGPSNYINPRDVNPILLMKTHSLVTSPKLSHFSQCIALKFSVSTFVACKNIDQTALTYNDDVAGCKTESLFSAMFFETVFNMQTSGAAGISVAL